MLLKWTIRAFAMAAALPLGIAAAQDTASLDVPAAADANLQSETPAAQDAQAPDAANGPQDAVPHEARFAPGNAPAGDQPQVADHVRAATQHLNIDDATRSRYRWHNGEWWFKTKSGEWKIYRDGQWIDFDPTTYQLPNQMSQQDFSPQSGGSAQTYGDSDGYYFQAQPYASRSYGGSYGAFRPTYGAYNGGYYGNAYNGGFNNGYYGQGYGGYGTGIQGYNPSNDRYYGYGPYGQPYSVNGGQYRGAVLGSQIGGQLGGNTGAMIGGAIGARAGR